MGASFELQAQFAMCPRSLLDDNPRPFHLLDDRRVLLIEVRGVEANWLDAQVNITRDNPELPQPSFLTVKFAHT